MAEMGIFYLLRRLRKTIVRHENKSSIFLYNIYHIRSVVKTLKFKKIPELKRFNPNKINNFIKKYFENVIKLSEIRSTSTQ